jgi:hypothetical protein
MIAEANVVEEGLETGSMQAKLHILQQPIRYASDPSNQCFTRNVCVEVHYQEWSLDRKIVDKFGRFATVRIGKRTAGAGQAHPFYVVVHARPVIAEALAVKCAVQFEMPHDGICVEGNEKNVIGLLGNQLKARV